MGGEPSKVEEAPIEPWREINWEDKESALQYVRNYKPQTEGQQLRILLYGPVGAGKSSFINSVHSVLNGRMYAQALADNTFHDSFTKQYTTYKIPKRGPETFYPFVFNDIMGLDPCGGCQTGHDGTCEGRLQGIPQVAILTKIDEVCPELKKDLKNFYRTKYLKEKMKEFSAEVGIPVNCIFPVKNYHSEIDLNDEVDSLILSALKSIINFGDDCINFHKNRPECSDTKSSSMSRLENL